MRHIVNILLTVSVLLPAIHPLSAQQKKPVAFYLENLPGERIGEYSDERIISDLQDDGFVVIEVDCRRYPQTSPELENALVEFHKNSPEVYSKYETADIEIVENCYSTGSGKVKLRTYLTLDGNGKLREARHLVMCSTDPAYTIGQDLEEIPVLWTSTECDFASLTQRHVMNIRYCLESGTGKLYTEGYEVVDNKLNRERMKLIVMESTDPNINIGDSFETIPDGYTRVACLCNCD